ncbi:helix-turn-helix transcriptional regulator [Herbiconiux sp.]|uniref:helix-turn-helix domain-containing protein n=1 Tax=Herbiconiux sp. TaxID=1871186 RepID=UPI0025BB341A|nr:helix-turn-helix transcriptional regulator [Herbiconiux sp.]
MDNVSNPLGSFLRARRELVTPEQAGITGDGLRRVPGLRREEVAMLAGISADYYLRLERGRDRSPSVQVLESIARVLQLDDEHLEHLLALVTEVPRRRRRRTRREPVPPGVLSMLHSLVQPAFIEDRYFDILATNHLAQTLSPGLTVGRNQLHDLFLDSEEQARYPDWTGMTECFVASYRQAVGTDIDDPRYIELVGELSLASPRFRELWARHDVRAQRGSLIRFEHPQVGALTLNREAMTIGGTNGLTLVVYHPDRGSADEDKLALLASADVPFAETSRNDAPSSSRPVHSPAAEHAADPDVR